jgi:hypothetical protein
MLCSSTVINPGDPNVPAGARELGGWGSWDDDEEDMPKSGNVWNE